MLIRLVKNGIYPIKFDQSGHQLDNNINFNSLDIIYNEGKLSGAPSIFLKTAGCNLRCAFYSKEHNELSICNLPESSFFDDTHEEYTIEECFNIIKHNIKNITHLVITGGEPTIQHRPLSVLCKRIKEELNVHITLETNGTLFASELFELIDLFSISPKLRFSIPNNSALKYNNIALDEKYTLLHKNLRLNLPVLQKIIDLCYINPTPRGYTLRKEHKDFELKFVVGSNNDLIEIKEEYLHYLKGVNHNDIWIIPMGTNGDQISKVNTRILDRVYQNNWNYNLKFFNG